MLSVRLSGISEARVKNINGNKNSYLEYGAR